MLMKNRQLTSFEHFLNNLLSTSYKHYLTTLLLEKQDERHLSTTITIHTLLRFFSFLFINDYTASSLRVILEKTFHRTRVLFFRRFSLVYYSFFSHESFFEQYHIDVRIYSFIHSYSNLQTFFRRIISYFIRDKMNNPFINNCFLSKSNERIYMRQLE
jgi:hypothetical protein